MMKHLSDVHGINVKAVKAKKTLVAHMDAATWFQSTYEWEIDGQKYAQTICQERDAESAAFWSGPEDE